MNLPRTTPPSTITTGPGSGPHFSELPPLSLYVHLPWCARKCPYCDFNSHRVPLELPEQRYIEALKHDLEGALPNIWGRRVQTIFIGGGTPSLFSAAGIDQMLSTIRARTVLAPDAEITLEANPGAIEAGKFAAFRSAGVNRLSLGIQTFQAQHLKALGRIHDSNDARRAVELAVKHYTQFNLDLMFALPGQQPDELSADLREALTFDPPHISIYHLTIEPNTVFAKYPPKVPDPDDSAALQEIIEGALEDQGYAHYEVSAFARTDHRCRHNLNYWTYGDYLGIGAGAHSKLTFPDRVIRQARTRNPDEYMARANNGTHIAEQAEVKVTDLPFEYAMNAFRLRDGFPLEDYTRRTGLAVTTLLPTLARAEERGLIERDHVRVRTTAHGQRFLNDLLELFLPD